MSPQKNSAKPNAPRLRVPTARARPGDDPDFSHIDKGKAGAVARPPIDACARDIIDHAFQFIRVLDDNGQAVGPWDPKLDVDRLKEGLGNMLKTRIYDDSMIGYQRTGRMSFYIKSRGEEAISVSQAMLLRGSDMAFPTYRQQGFLITRGCSLYEMACQCFSNAADPLKGHQLPTLYGSKKYGLFSISGNLATQYPQAVGWAMANAYKGNDDLAISWVGDGSTAEGDFHWALNFGSVYRAPVILCVVNNQWAISSYQAIAGGDESTFASRGLGYGIPGLRVDGNDFLAVYAATKWAEERARAGFGPTLIECFTYRAEGHSTSDDPSKYRPRDESALWPFGDPVDRLKAHLIALGVWSDDEHKALVEAVTKDVKAEIKKAEKIGTLNSGNLPSPALMFEDVYQDMPAHLLQQRQRLGF